MSRLDIYHQFRTILNVLILQKNEVHLMKQFLLKLYFNFWEVLEITLKVPLLIFKITSTITFFFECKCF